MSYATPPVPGGPDNLNAPLYGATIGQAFARFWKKYATFSGRASRSEFWWVYLINSIISYAIGGVWLGTAFVPALSNIETDPNATMGALASPSYIVLLVYALATLIPSLAIAWRRFHDTGRSGLWIFISLIPLVGWIIQIVLLASGPKPEGARFDRA